MPKSRNRKTKREQQVRSKRIRAARTLAVLQSQKRQAAEIRRMLARTAAVEQHPSEHGLMKETLEKLQGGFSKMIAMHQGLERE